MHEMKTLTLNGETFDSFVDQTARQKADEAVRTVNGKNPDENGNIEIKVNAADAAEVAALVARAETAATDAEADAKSARTAATEANNAKGSAMQSASTASAKAILAQTHAGTATEKATAAEESATNASASATRAETAATSADAAATRATEAAERAENASSNSGGNVALTADQISALDGMFKIASFTADPTNAYKAFMTAFGIAEPEGPDVPDVPIEPDEPEITLTSISAVYSGGDVAVGTAVTALTGIVVTAHYSDGSTATVTDYTLSGEIAEGNNTVTVSYGGKTTTFAVTGYKKETVFVENAPVVAIENYYLKNNGTGEPITDSTAAAQGVCVTDFISYEPDTVDRTMAYYLSDPNKELNVTTMGFGIYKDGTFVKFRSHELTNAIKTGKIINANSNQVRFTLATDSVDDSYAYFEATGEVIFAGKNTKYYGHGNIQEVDG